MSEARNYKFLLVLALGAAVALLATAIVAGLADPGEYETEQSATRSFTIDEDFTKVRKILVRKDGAKQLVTLGGGSVFRDQKWDQVGGDVESLKLLDPEWTLTLHGVLQVTTEDDYIGEQDIDLVQDVRITPDLLDSVVKLANPAERLRDYEMRTHFERVEPAGGAGTTRVELTLMQRIRTDAPWFAHGIADRRVKASVEKRLENQEAAIRKFIADNINDVPLLPLR